MLILFFLQAVQDLHNKEWGDKTLYVGRAQKRAERQAELKERFDRLKQERMNRYQGVNLYVKNLDDNIDDERLRIEFSQFGTITSAKVRQIVQYGLMKVYLFQHHFFLAHL